MYSLNGIMNFIYILLASVLILNVFLVCSIGANDPSATCDASVRCACCFDGTCRPDTGYCESCNYGYWGGFCKNRCPPECVHCKQNFRADNLCGECIPGHYGQDCSSKCSTGCNVCSKDSGECEECSVGYYTQDCSQSCSERCKDRLCDKLSGKCYECSVGYYGDEMCNMPCPSNCFQDMCSQTMGSCIGCKAGYFGQFCLERCSDKCKANRCYDDGGECFGCLSGYFGDICNDTCSVACIDNVCDQYTGHCSYGCLDGFIGDMCDVCVSGKYGDACDKDCSLNCLNSECLRDDGACNSGCVPGYSDLKFCCANNSNCEACSSYTDCISCIDGTYGPFCDQSCPINCASTCDKVLGHCLQCKLNYYGIKCRNQCSTHCLATTVEGKRCHSNNGSCTVGCIEKYYGTKCDKECSRYCNGSCDRHSGKCYICSLNRYGMYCEYTCSKGCVTRIHGTQICNKETGKCEFGCLEGLTGHACNKEASATGSSTAAVAAGVSVSLAVVLLLAIGTAYIVRKRKLCFPKDTPGNVYDDLQGELRSTGSEYAAVTLSSCNSTDEHSHVYANTQIH